MGLTILVIKLALINVESVERFRLIERLIIK